jgi:hypothetical protein
MLWTCTMRNAASSIYNEGDILTSILERFPLNILRDLVMYWPEAKITINKPATAGVRDDFTSPLYRLGDRSSVLEGIRLPRN